MVNYESGFSYDPNDKWDLYGKESVGKISKITTAGLIYCFRKRRKSDKC